MKGLHSSWPKAPVRWQIEDTVYYSIPFTWNLPLVRYELLVNPPDKVIVGGPAVYLLPDFFIDMSFVSIGKRHTGALQIVNPNATKTTTGCVRRCEFCLVSRVEGKLKELSNWPDLPILIDNNILAASESHFDKAMDRLEKHDYQEFSSGIDSRLITEYHAERFARLKSPRIVLALDSFAYKEDWQIGFDLLRKAGVRIRSIRSYALIGYNSGPEEAWDRCNWIEARGIPCLPMWFHPLDTLDFNSVTEKQQAMGWSTFERKRIMGWFYKHREALTQSKSVVL